MPNLVPKQGEVICVFRRGGRWQLSRRRGCFSGSIKRLSYGDDAAFLAKLARIKDASPLFARITLMPGPASPPVHKVFDYASLDAGISQFVLEQTGEIKGLMKRTAQGIVGIGQKLIEVKAKLGHGRFGDWLEAEFDWSTDTAQRFMRVAQVFAGKPQFAVIAPSALYELAAPSTTETARAEAITRAEAGEPITYTVAKAIKQKYAAPPKKPRSEPQREPELQPQLVAPQPTLIPALPSQSSSKLEIVAIRTHCQALPLEPATKVIASQAAPTLLAPQRSQPVFAPDVPGLWWQLSGRHLLYCGEPNSPEILGRVSKEKVGLLLAFPPTLDWLPPFAAKARFISTEYLPQGRKLDQLDEFLEASILFNTNLGELVISCFLPSPVILSIVNRLDRRGLFVDPDEHRCKAFISDWKKAGLKVERLS